MEKKPWIMNSQWNKREIFGISLFDWIIFFLISLLWLIGEYFLYQYHFFPLTRGETDGIEYMQMAQSPFFTLNPYHGPGYPFSIRLVRILTGLPIFSAAKLATILAGYIFLFSIFILFSKLLLSHGEAISTTLFLAINGVFLTHSNLILGDVQSAALFYTSIWVLLCAKRRPFIGVIFSGIFAGLAYLTRYIFSFTLIIPILLFIFNPFQENLRKRLLSFCCFYLAFGMTILPWAIYLFRETGNPFWNLNHLNIAFKMYRNGQGWNVFPTLSEFPNIFSVVFSNFKLFIFSWLDTFLALPNEFVKIVPVVGFFSITGIPLWLRNKDRFRLIILIIIFVYGILESLVWHEARFLLIIIPLIIALASNGIYFLCSELVKRIYTKLPKIRILKGTLFYFFILVLVIASSIRTFPLTPYFSDQSIEYINAIEWLNMQSDVDMIMSAKPHIPFFANAKWISFRDFNMQTAGLSDLPEIICKAKPEYFIYDERYSGTEFPQFSILLNSEENPFPSLLSPVYEIDKPYRLVIYIILLNCK